ncbi:hypothetical protein FsymDg_1180 [Candidatus Protofrankia datiscae]|uniref:Uncharacterized protein n=1 Tax=Candidatus Protofrankia datiscae TaxID=2716812 RepID=F8AZJ8_9ACTN|nr:hypothetical protein FsymDg_1180 [Candidatus Protofrankia datiscae]
MSGGCWSLRAALWAALWMAMWAARDYAAVARIRRMCERGRIVKETGRSLTMARPADSVI